MIIVEIIIVVRRLTGGSLVAKVMRKGLRASWKRLSLSIYKLTRMRIMV